MADLVRTIRNARRVAPPTVRPLSAQEMTYLDTAGAGSGLIDPTRTGTDPATVERIRRQNQGYAFDFLSALTGHPVRPGAGDWWDLTNPNQAANWASLLLGGRIPDKTVPTNLRGITISRVPSPQHPWSWVGENTGRWQYPQGQRPPLYLHYEAKNRQGEVVGAMTMAMKRHGKGGPVKVSIPVAWTEPYMQRTSLLNDMLAIPRATGLPVKVAKSSHIAHQLMKQYGHG
jgi:hypothetical protein